MTESQRQKTKLGVNPMYAHMYLYMFFTIKMKVCVSYVHFNVFYEFYLGMFYHKNVVMCILRTLICIYLCVLYVIMTKNVNPMP